MGKQLEELFLKDQRNVCEGGSASIRQRNRKRGSHHTDVSCYLWEKGTGRKVLFPGVVDLLRRKGEFLFCCAQLDWLFNREEEEAYILDCGYARNPEPLMSLVNCSGLN